MILANNEIIQLEKRYRANLINSLGGFKSFVLIGTKSISGNENLAPFSSFFHIGADPALCGIIVRPCEPKQNTLGNILSTGQYTINHVLPSFYKKAHQCSAKYAEGASEFDQVNLTPEYVADIVAPFVQESAIKFACAFVQKIDLTINNTYLIIGKIVKIIIPEETIGTDGFIHLESAQTITCSGLDSYHTTQQLARLTYAKINEEVREL